MASSQDVTASVTSPGASALDSGALKPSVWSESVMMLTLEPEVILGGEMIETGACWLDGVNLINDDRNVHDFT